jgi:hypothetical protein
MCSPWFELTILFGTTSFGQIFFGHFEERTPKWRKVLKTVAFGLLAAWVSTQFGRIVFFSIFGLLLLGVVIIHAWWLPSKGVNGWTGEPRERYYQLRGWKYPS